MCCLSHIGTQGILLEAPAKFAVWQRRLQEALGHVGQTLVDIVPSLEMVVGKPPPAPILAPTEAENRLMFLLDRLLRAFCVEQPLVLFLDDLQWADAATLKFIERWYNDKACNAGMMLLGSYRSDEVLPGHPLLDALESLTQRSQSYGVITLEPMAPQDIEALLHDATGRDDTAELAEVLHQKTAGNAFFVREYLRSLAQSRHIQRDAAASTWVWDLQAIRGISGTRNAVDFMIGKLTQMAQPEQHRLLSIAARLGNTFSINMLAQIADVQQAHVLGALQPALDAGFILPVGRQWRYAEHTGADVAYQFVHDKVHEAARALLTGEELLRAHYKIGNRLLKDLPKDRVTENVFLAADHLNAAKSLLDGTERAALAELNARAAAEAQQATAFDVAARYWDHALAEWEPARLPQARHARLQAANCEYLIGKRDQAEERLRSLLADSTDVMEQVEIHRTRAKCLVADMRPFDSLAAAKQALVLLGVKLPKKTHLGHVALGLLAVRRALGERTIESLVDLPTADDPQVRLIISICQEMTAAAYFNDTNLYALMVCKMCCVVLQRGSASDTPFIYAAIASMYAALGQQDVARQYGYVARTLMARDSGYSAALLSLGVTVDYAELHARDHVKYFNQAAIRGMGAGEVTNGTLSMGMVHNALILVNLDEHAESTRNSEALRRQLDRDYSHYAIVNEQLEHCIRGTSIAPNSFTNDHFDEAQFLAKITTGEMGGIAPAHYYMMRTVANCVHRDFERGVSDGYAAIRAGILQRLSENNAFCFEFFFAALLGQNAISNHGKTRHRKQLLNIQKHFHKVVFEGAIVAQGAAALVDGLLLAASHDVGAGKSFEQATRLLDDTGYNAYAAVAHECAARYYFHHGMDAAAQIHLRRAENFFRLWGAHRKLQQLHQEFGIGMEVSAPTSRTMTGGTSDFGERLDIPALMRATQAMTREVALDRVANVVITTAQEIAGGTRAALLITNGSGTLVVQADNASSGLPLDVLQYVTRSHEVVVDDDPATGSRWAKDAYLNRAKPRSILCAPLIMQGTLHGAIYMENSLTPKIFTRERVDLVKMLAVQAAVSLQNARLYADLEKQVATRSQELREAQSRLLEAQRDSAEMRMAGGFAHEMLNALSGARYTLGSVLNEAGLDEGIWPELRRMVQTGETPSNSQQDANPLFSDLSDSLRTVQQSVLRGITVTNRILQYAEVSTLLPGSEALHMNDVVQSAVAKMQERPESIRYEVDVPQDVSVLASREHVSLILSNLLSNARDAVLARGDAQDRLVKVGCQRYEGQILVTIEDTGVGVNEEVRAHLFEPFFSTKGSAGVGLGLGLSRKVARLYGGDIHCEDFGTPGARFRLTMPLLS